MIYKSKLERKQKRRTTTVVIVDVCQAEEARNVVLDHPTDGRADGVAFFSHSFQDASDAAADTSFLVKG